MNRYISRYRLFLRREKSFFKDLAFVSVGNAFGYVLGFVITPFLASTYGPEVYGSFTVVFALSKLLSNVYSWGYESAVQVPKERYFGLLLAKLAIFLSIFAGIITFLIFLLFGVHIVDFFNLGVSPELVLIVPLYAFLMSMGNIFAAWSIRVKQFKRESVSKLLSIVVSKLTALAAGVFIGPSTSNFIYAVMLEYPISIATLFSRKLRKQFKLIFQGLQIDELKKIGVKFWKYPTMITASKFLNILSDQLPLYILAIVFSREITGNFSFARSMTMAPVMLFSLALMRVYFQRASEFIHLNKRSELQSFTLRVFEVLMLISCLLFTGIVFCQEYLIYTLLGHDWAVASDFVLLLCISAPVLVLSSVLISLLRLMQKESVFLIITLIRVLIVFGALILAKILFPESSERFVLFFSLAMMLSGILIIITTLRKLEITWKAIFLRLTGFGLLYAIMLILATKFAL